MVFFRFSTFFSSWKPLVYALLVDDGVRDSCWWHCRCLMLKYADLIVVYLELSLPVCNASCKGCWETFVGDWCLSRKPSVVWLLNAEVCWLMVDELGICVFWQFWFVCLCYLLVMFMGSVYTSLLCMNIHEWLLQWFFPEWFVKWKLIIDIGLWILWIFLERCWILYVHFICESIDE